MATACSTVRSTVRSTTISFAAPLEAARAEAPRVYRLRKSIAAVHFGSSEKGQIVFLPDGAELRVVGPSRLCRCCEVLCEDRLYNMFEVDLLGPWSIRLKRRPMRPVEDKTAAACA
jgi:hypothetical protein